MIRVTAASILALSFSTVAHAAVVNFETAAHGQTVTEFVSTDGSVSGDISATGGANEARGFDTNETNTADPDLEANFQNVAGGPTLAPGTVLIIQEAAFQASSEADDNRSGGVITFTFDEMETLLGFTILDDATITVISDLGGTYEASVAKNGGFGIFSFDDPKFAGVSWLTFDFNGESGAIDNLIFADDDDNIAPVPLPAALPLLLVGLGGLGALSRRRKS